MSISYSSGNQFDGAGAQLQRLASIYALSRYLNIEFIKTPLSGVTVHATDPFRTEDDYKQYLTRVGNFLHQDVLDCNNPDPNCKSMDFIILSAFNLFRIVVLNIFQRDKIHLNVFQANSIIDSWPKLIADYVAKTGKAFQSSATGLFYHIEKPGAGANPKMGETWVVNYRGTFMNGKEFDKGSSSEMPLGQMIPGFNEALTLLKAGGKGTFVIPSTLGYGDQARGPIPANSVLVFELEVLSKK
jgi:hypothetical protein